MSHAQVVICGAGMAGAAAAYHLAARRRVRDIVIVDERAPLTLTSDKGTQAYRNWFVGPDDTMVRFMNRSIDILEEMAEESRNTFRLNRRGYLFVTADESEKERMRATALSLSGFGAGAVREHPGATTYAPSPAEEFREVPTGADVLLDAELIRREFPYLARDVVAATHVRRAGWMNAVRLGHWMLEQAAERGARLLRDRVTGIDVAGNRVRAVRLASGARIDSDNFIIAAGPYLPNVAGLMGIELPVFHELHGKMAFDDELGIVPRGAPMTIWVDPLHLPWTEAERVALGAEESTRPLLRQFPGGVHVRPRDDETGRTVLLIWTYDIAPHAPDWPPTFDEHYGEVLVRGLARMAPAADAYFGRGRTGYVDGGYYCKTPENRPLVGPLPVEGAYVTGALSGYGIMGSHAAGELLAAHLTGETLPPYADAMRPSRYDDPTYGARLAELGALSGQL